MNYPVCGMVHKQRSFVAKQSCLPMATLGFLSWFIVAALILKCLTNMIPVLKSLRLCVLYCQCVYGHFNVCNNLMDFTSQ